MRWSISSLLFSIADIRPEAAISASSRPPNFVPASKGTILELESEPDLKNAKNVNIKKKSQNNQPKRIWLVAGSGGILQALYKAFPNLRREDVFRYV